MSRPNISCYWTLSLSLPAGCREGETQTSPESPAAPVASTPIPVAKPRTLLMQTLPPDESSFSSSLPRVTSSGSVEGQVTGTPPTPRPRPRSGEQEMRQRVNKLETQLSEKDNQLLEKDRELQEARRKITQLETRNRKLERDDTDVKLQATVRAKEEALTKAQSLLQKRESRIAGLEEEVNVLKQPYDPRKRLEVRLSEAIGKNKELEKEMIFLKKVEYCVMCV